MMPTFKIAYRIPGHDNTVGRQSHVAEAPTVEQAMDKTVASWGGQFKKYEFRWIGFTQRCAHVNPRTGEQCKRFGNLSHCGSHRPANS